LNFIQDGAPLEPSDKATDIGARGGECRRIVECVIAKVPPLAHLKCEGGLAALSRSVDQNNRRISECRRQGGFGKPAIKCDLSHSG
jgi:hypothetical protein